jgi:ubiquinone/menaquinone biosynthesis C-methylase UbiE
MKHNKPTINEVYNFWNENFLYSFEVEYTPGSKEFFEAIDKLRQEDIEKFSMHLWKFDQQQGKKVLDIGCGPGWLVRHYASSGADIYAIDIAHKAVELTQKMLEIYNLKANVQQANAEEIPFEDNTFDFISSSGVLHHTPDMQKAVNEAYRVLKPGCEATISVYYKNILLQPSIFPLFLRIYRLLKPQVPGREKLKVATDPNDFIRMYDGEQNPVGYGLTINDCKEMFSKFEILGYEIHFFPKRFFPLFKYCPNFLYRLLDKYFGTMIYLKLRKNPDDK